MKVKIDQNETSLMISWDNGLEKEYCFQILDDLRDWKTLYRGSKTSFKVENLAPCEVYKFRLKSADAEWHTFKGATCERITYSTRHLFSAMRSQKFGMIRKLVKIGPELLEIENKKANTPLIQAVSENDSKMVNLFLHLGASINKPLMFSGKTPLLVAVAHGFVELTKFLVNKGASTKDVDINGLGVMHYAVCSGNFEMIQYFVGLGLDVNAKDRNGLTPLLRAVILELDGRVIEYLLQNGADPNICDQNGFDFDQHRCLNNKNVITAITIPKFIFSRRGTNE